ncbi:Hpt domain-containing protein [Arthrobacter zhaoxinii]|uniref:Hpt domain-containing protein n=1 Tax=Arthrobacter zhaoxinii TaxID=2964616 RepID=A0ABY5YS97_9MICC|nr:Hpt domain-containing protein [Arthrobacter zhaoxinii]UWX97989.1 Hpt domain-containing protein [Arthrobacter zhaoxinii]
MPREEIDVRLISLERLRELSDQVGTESCRQFVSNFISMWESRFTRLCQAVQGRDFDAAMDVVLSIKISSDMAGAERLSALGAAAQDLVSRRDILGLEAMVAAVRACGTETMAHLNQPSLFSAA